MSFHATPSGSMREQQQPVSLLFSPTLKATDGQKHSPAALGRSPSATPAPFGTPATGFGAQGATPPSRRRSLTPASSMAKDTPPPPPADSLLDSPGLGGAAFGGWATAEPNGVEDMATSPSGAAAHATVAAPPQPSAAAGDYAAAGRALRDYDSTWVTVFGFASADVPAVLSEFGKCGDIEGFGTYEDGPHVNWLHIKFAVSRRCIFMFSRIYRWKLDGLMYFLASFDTLSHDAAPVPPSFSCRTSMRRSGRCCGLVTSCHRHVWWA
jgi:hypothetical protein